MLGRARVSLSVAAAAAIAAAAVAPIGAGAAEMTGVLVRDSSYAPAEQRINVGDTVIFARTKQTKLAHSVTADNGTFDVEINEQQSYAGFRFPNPGTYTYRCKYHGSAGMVGVVHVEDAAATTTTTAPGPTTTTTPTTGPTTTTSTAPTTTTTAPPTTTTTKPPKPTTTTTAPAPPPPPPTTTTTTQPPPPVWQPPPPPPPAPAGPAASPPPAGRPASTPTTAPRGKPDNGKDRNPSAANGDSGKAVPPGPDPAAPPAPPPPDPAAIAAADAAAAAAAAATPQPEAAPPAPVESQAVEPLDPAILDTLAAATGEKPPDNGSKLLLVAGLGLGLFAIGAASWAWYHRSSRYMPA